MDDVPTPKPARAKRARTPKADEFTPKTRTDVKSPEERRAANVAQIAKSFYGVNEAIASRMGDDFYEVQPAEAQQWAEAAIETSEWLGVGEIPPPLTLLVVTLNIYIPRAFHYWVTGRVPAEGYEDPPYEVPPAPPPFVDAPA